MLINASPERVDVFTKNIPVLHGLKLVSPIGESHGHPSRISRILACKSCDYLSKVNSGPSSKMSQRCRTNLTMSPALIEFLVQRRLGFHSHSHSFRSLASAWSFGSGSGHQEQGHFFFVSVCPLLTLTPINLRSWFRVPPWF